MQSLVTYLVGAMIAWVPLSSQPSSEARADAQARYESIAQDVASVVTDDAEAPLFDGPDGRAQTALLMLSVASFESSYRKTVDDGRRRGDGGHSYCLMQVRVGGATTREGFTGQELIDDRKRCFRAALHLLHLSFNACHSLPVEDRLGAYATGHCFLAASVSRTRVERARNYSRAHAPPRMAPVTS